MDPAVIGAFFAGIGAVISSGIALWLTRHKAEQECEKRFAAFREGIKTGRDK